MNIKNLKELVLICLDGQVPVTLIRPNENNEFMKEYGDVVDFILDEKIDHLEIDDKIYHPVQISNRQVVIWLK